jgi:hypothetical protein
VLRSRPPSPRALPERDRLHDLLLVRLVPLVDADVPAETWWTRFAGHPEDVDEVVRDEHDGDALLGESLDEGEHLPVCATPSAAVGSSRKTTRLFHHRPRDRD